MVGLYWYYILSIYIYAWFTVSWYDTVYLIDVSWCYIIDVVWLYNGFLYHVSHTGVNYDVDCGDLMLVETIVLMLIWTGCVCVFGWFFLLPIAVSFGWVPFCPEWQCFGFLHRLAGSLINRLVGQKAVWLGCFGGVARFRTLMMIGMSNLRSHQGRCPQVPRSALFGLDISLDISLDSVVTDPDR